ncbi:MAG TPA: ribosome-associated translation inhibitor RaiA [Acidimicrobiales bacterium]|nr:ribosome-associated translation inhibitor RaiA [Acidimicrobiales bacterium]
MLDFDIAARHTEISEDVRHTAQDKLGRLDRFLYDVKRAEVRFREEHNPRIRDREVCEVTLHGPHHVVRASASAPDMLAAVDLVVEKLEHRLVRLKGRLVGRSHPRRRPPLDSRPGQSGPDGQPGDGDDDQPQIVRTKQFELKPMTPTEAALEMQLLGHDFYLFSNSDTGRAAVVYRRRDGQTGLIDAA